MPKAKTTRAAKRAPRKPVPQQDREPSGLYVGATITLGDESSRYGTRSGRDLEWVGRASVLTVATAAALNATACMTQRLRLYRPTRGAAKSLYPGRKVTSRKALGWLTGEGKRTPGRKAVALASSAGDVEEVTDHPVLDLLYRPDPFSEGSSWFWLMHWYAEVTGRAYVYKGERQGNEPTSLYLLAPQYTRPIASRREFISGYRYGLESTSEITLPPEDVGYYRLRVNPSRPLEAWTWLHGIAGVSDLEAAAVQAEIARWSNGGRPGMVMKAPETMSNIACEQARAHINAQIRGVNREGSVLVTKGLELQKDAAKPHEMQYVQGAERAEAMIFRAAGIPETIWKMADANRASALAGDPQYMGQTVLPRINSLAEFLTENILSEFDPTGEMWLAYDDPVSEDRLALVDENIKLTTAGLKTGNEARAEIGLEPGGPELDVLRWNGTPLSMPGAGGQDGQVPEGDSNGEEANGAESGQGGEEGGEEKPGDGAGGESGAGGEGVQDEGGKASRHLDTVKAATFACNCCRKDDRIVTEPEVKFAEELKAWFEKAVREGIAENGAVDINALIPELNQIAARNLEAIFRSGVAEAGAEFRPGNLAAAASNYTSRRGALLVQSVTETLKERLRNEISSGMAAGETVNQIRDRIVSQDIPETRAEVIVRTETQQAFNATRTAAGKELGHTHKRWVTVGDNCPLCDAMEAKYGSGIPIDQNYVNAGDTIVGTDGKAYTFSRTVDGEINALAHPQCNCESQTYFEEEATNA